MKLKVQIVEGPSGRHLALTDENDAVLPMISKVEIVSEPDNVDRVIVTFILDGDQVKLVESKS